MHVRSKSILATFASLSLLLLSSTPAQAFYAYGRTWSNPGGTKYLVTMASDWNNSQIAAISSGVLAWNGISGSTLNVNGATFTSSATTFGNAAYKLDKIAIKDWTAPPGYIAATCRSVNCSTPFNQNYTNQAIIKFNSNFTFTNSWAPQYFAVDLETILVHELGHSHGLGHPYDNPNTPFMTSSEVAAVMNDNNTTKRIPRADDILAISTTY